MIKEHIGKRGRETSSVASTSHVPTPAKYDLSARYRSRRKNNVAKIWTPVETSYSDTLSWKWLDKPAIFVQDKALILKVSNWFLFFLEAMEVLILDTGV